MAQIPKGRLVKGPSKPICRDCTIYFWITASWFFTCLTDSTTVKTPSNHHLGNIFRWLPTTEQANLKRRSRQFWGASFRTSCFSINYSDQAGAWSPQNAGKKRIRDGPLQNPQKTSGLGILGNVVKKKHQPWISGLSSFAIVIRIWSISAVTGHWGLFSRKDVWAFWSCDSPHKILRRASAPNPTVTGARKASK